jgi:DNA-binding response OmpR family regulator
VKTVLVVDDEIGILDALDAAFKDEGYRTHVATNGRAALDIIKDEHVDIVVLDYMMPILDGKKTLDAIRAKDEKLPVVMLSALNEQSIITEGVKGYDVFLRKPFDLLELLAIMEKLLTRRS